jgi:hypothetical protein
LQPDKVSAGGKDQQRRQQAKASLNRYLYHYECWAANHTTMLQEGVQGHDQGAWFFSQGHDASSRSDGGRCGRGPPLGELGSGHGVGEGTGTETPLGELGSGHGVGEGTGTGMPPGTMEQSAAGGFVLTESRRGLNVVHVSLYAYVSDNGPYT